MNDDLISRQEAIDYLLDDLYDLEDTDCVDKEFIEEGLKRVPTVQPEQRTATFYVDSEGYERCSACNEHESGMRYFNFCPNCGAKMEGVK